MNVQLEEVETKYKRCPIENLNPGDLFYFDETLMMVTSHGALTYLVVELSTGARHEFNAGVFVSTVKQLEPLLFSLVKE